MFGYVRGLLKMTSTDSVLLIKGEAPPFLRPTERTKGRKKVSVLTQREDISREKEKGGRGRVGHHNPHKENKEKESSSLERNFNPGKKRRKFRIQGGQNDLV